MLEDWSATDIATLATAAAVVVAVAFGIAQFRQQNRKRRDAAAIEVVHTLQTAEVRRAFKRIMQVPDGARASVIRAHRQLREDADVIIFNLETMGVMVFDGILPLHTYDYILGAFTRASFRKVRRYLDEERAAGSAYTGEWFQWLAEQLEKHPAPRRARPAHLSFADWRP